MAMFEGKIALVTGAGSGIGRASALAFAREGAKVAVADVQEKAGEETVSLIQQAGGTAVFIKADVSKEAEVRAMVGKTVEVLGGLHYAHNNAGVRGERVRMADCTEETWDRILDTNLKSVWLCMKYEILHMIKHGGGAIVNTSSVGGVAGLPKLGPYVASKHGIVGLTKTAALEYIRSGIRVNAICPGLIDTPMIQRTVYAKIRPTNPIRKFFRNTKKFFGYKALSLQQPAGRFGEADEVASAVVWLCSDGASFVNGHAMVIDGGYLVQ